MKMRWLQPALLTGCVILIGGIDYFTGPEIGFSLFYLVPITWGAWHGDRRVALLLAVIASFFWFSADAAWHGINFVTTWNGFTRFGIYLAIALLTSRLREDEARLRQLNARLQELLEQEQHLSRTDPLTDLPNRRLFVDELRRAGARIHRTGKPIAVSYIDLDRFKAFNDRFGHAAGDAVLRHVAGILERHVRGNDVAARLGGAQFAVLLDQCTEDNARKTMTRLLDQLVAGLREIAKGDVGVSVGVACFDGPQLSPEAMIDHADAAMYCAKGQGANRLYVTHLTAAPPAEPAAT
jgi:diguanylate cyclase (GGDEF)-like protein